MPVRVKLSPPTNIARYLAPISGGETGAGLAATY